MPSDTLIFDTGQNIVGIFSVKERKYTAYTGARLQIGSDRILRARDIVSYNGNRWDLFDLARFSGLGDDVTAKVLGLHTDMREIIWGRIRGRCLADTYKEHFPRIRSFPDTHIGSNWRDVYMTYKLWKCWKAGKLKVLGGQFVWNSAKVEDKAIFLTPK